MPDDRERGYCQSKVGMLILRNCGEVGRSQCAQCGRTVCRKHEVDTVDRTVICPECAGVQAQEGGADQTAELPKSVKRARRRRRWYRSTGYRSPYYGYYGWGYGWGHHHHHHYGRHHHHSDSYYGRDYYNERDERAFDERNEGIAEGAADADDFDDDSPDDAGYDYAES